MAPLAALAVRLFAAVALLPSLTYSASSSSSPVLSTGVGPDCLKGSKHDGKPTGQNITIAGVPTYLAEPPKKDANSTKVILYYSDIYSTFFINNMLMQDYFASQGYYVLGLDYFFGDPVTNHATLDLEPFDPDFDLGAWVAKSRAQAAAALPGWVQAVRERYGPNAKYTAVGYCFGGIYAAEQSATDEIVAGAFAHPGDLTEAHFTALKKPLLLNCAEVDSSFPAPNLYRAIDIMTAESKKYHVNIYSGTVHGFAIRGNMSDENAVWALQDAAKNTVDWFNRFTR